MISWDFFFKKKKSNNDLEYNETSKKRIESGKIKKYIIQLIKK